MASSKGWLGETLRAFLLFAILLAGLTGVAGVVAFQDMSRIIRIHRFNLAREEIRSIREAAAAVGRGVDGIEYVKLRNGKADLEQLVRNRMAERPYVQSVEIRDRFGAPIVALQRESSDPLVRGGREGATLSAGSKLMTVATPIQQELRPQGEVRLGIADEGITREVESLRRGLQLKVGIAAAVGVGLLVAGFVYVLRLIGKIRRLERARGSEERAIYTGVLASGLAHEIRNPLNAMNMNLQMLEEEMVESAAGPDPAALDLLGATKSEIKRLERLVNNFLQYARPQAPRFEPRDLNEVLSATALFLQADFRKNGVELAVDLEPMLPSVEIDEGQLKQALMNILLNARQVLRDGGRVQLRSRAGSGGEAVVEVADDGPGIAPEAVEKIFEPFFSNRSGGTGLGLPIARQIVQRHGGTIEVDTTVGKGTTFRIRLPRRHVAAGGREPAGPAR